MNITSLFNEKFSEEFNLLKKKWNALDDLYQIASILCVSLLFLIIFLSLVLLPVVNRNKASVSFLKLKESQLVRLKSLSLSSRSLNQSTKKIKKLFDLNEALLVASDAAGKYKLNLYDKKINKNTIVFNMKSASFDNLISYIVYLSSTYNLVLNDLSVKRLDEDGFVEVEKLILELDS